MTNEVLLTDKEKQMLFWASFLALAAAGFGFVFRVMLIPIWIPAFELTGNQMGSIFGASLWPIAVTMILFSLIIDNVGYKPSMMIAMSLQAISVVLTVVADNASMLWWASFSAGLGHGIIEAVINPLCATIYRHEKSKMLNILHAAWPAGIVGGGLIYLLGYHHINSNAIFWFMLLPVVIHGIMFLMCHHYPVDERVEANVSMTEMLKEFGGLGAFLAITFLFYELANQICLATGNGGTDFHNNLLTTSFIVGAVGGVIFGIGVKSIGQVLFFILCIIMIPLATAELSTDAWIKELMTPVLANEYALDAGWAIVASAFIMMVLRFFAGVPLKYMSPPALLLFSSIFSIVGLYLLAGATGALIFVAFVIYAVGQTFYWPTVLGFVSERFPKGGAMTLNTVSAMGLLTVGIFGTPFLGSVKDNFDAKAVSTYNQELYAKHKFEKTFFGVTYESVNKTKVLSDESLNNESKATLKSDMDNSARSTLKVAASLPAVMAIAFLLILIGFKMKGGYRPVILAPESDLIDKPDTIASSSKKENNEEARAESTNS